MVDPDQKTEGVFVKDSFLIQILYTKLEVPSSCSFYSVTDVLFGVVLLLPVLQFLLRYIYIFFAGTIVHRDSCEVSIHVRRTFLTSFLIHAVYRPVYNEDAL